MTPEEANFDPHYTPEIRQTTAKLSMKNHFDHLCARWGWRRAYHRVVPGLYRLGNPADSSSVFVTGNYTLSFDALRSNLKGQDCWILVLNTLGINVWCAAGKGTFSSRNLITAIKETNLETHVSHRTLILPQLCATGVSGNFVQRESGFQCLFGPCRAVDIPTYLGSGKKTTIEMRKASFTLRERMTLIPIEFLQALKYTTYAAVLFFLLFGKLWVIGAYAAMFVGTVLFPIFLPALPFKYFTVRGFALSPSVTLPVVLHLLRPASLANRTFLLGLIHLPPSVAFVLALLLGLLMTAAVGFFAMNFTGATPFAPKSSVYRETLLWLRYIPVIGRRAVKLVAESGAQIGVKFNPDECISCGRCTQVCPQGVFARDPDSKKIVLAHPEQCMECGACAINCPQDNALKVDMGVGCAYALIYSAITNQSIIDCPEGAC